MANAVAYPGYPPPYYQPMAHGGPPPPGQFPQYGGAAAPHYGYSEIVPPSPSNHGARIDDMMSLARASGSGPHLPSHQDEPSENQNTSI
jgi:hypothetical protein